MFHTEDGVPCCCIYFICHNGIRSPPWLSKKKKHSSVINTDYDVFVNVLG